MVQINIGSANFSMSATAESEGVILCLYQFVSRFHPYCVRCWGLSPSERPQRTYIIALIYINYTHVRVYICTIHPHSASFTYQYTVNSMTRQTRSTEHTVNPRPKSRQQHFMPSYCMRCYVKAAAIYTIKLHHCSPTLLRNVCAECGTESCSRLYLHLHSRLAGGFTIRLAVVHGTYIYIYIHT